ncbi:MAG: hydantoinase/oxoprolinase family protein [Candidatus Methanoplasma sp.]|jgi:N-methylhydantoinase A/oxoprolinase/acetone carboxylase beta subunit|nr:hydantoinase/oxoprolinase family protein [Candidatus Methanoplasma sp.]
MWYGLGLDTGGTYTDAVLMDISSGKIVGKAKALTTRDDLSVGIDNAVKGLRDFNGGNVAVVSLSSTLATNSIVEGKGCRVGLVTVGRDFDGSIPVDTCFRISGGHDIRGMEACMLDEEAARASLALMKDKIDGIAVTSYMSVRNPDHENRVKKIATEILDVPVVCGHELSSSLGFNERTVTSLINSRLIPIIKELIESVKEVMAENGIGAPLMIVRGDGSIMSETVAVERPVETILSGPAASLIGAKNLTGIGDAVVMDMGGTTTDIGILRNGYPRLEKEGAVIGGKRTHVLAAEISTSGIGGDSRIVVDGGRFYLSPMRVIPLCIASDKWPQIKKKMREVSEARSKRASEGRSSSNTVQDMEFFTMVRASGHVPLTDADRRFMELISSEPHSLNEAAAKLGVHPFDLSISKMEEFGIIQRIGITPTDILHAEGSYVQHDAEASVCGIGYAADRMRLSPCEFIALAKERIVYKLSEELLRKLFFEETRELNFDRLAKDLMDKAISGKEGLDFGCSVRLNKPIIGIGAPVAAYFPQVAEKFGAKLLLPEHSEVGNAVGAITGSIMETLDVVIRPKVGGNPDDPPCTAFSMLGKMDFKSASEALDCLLKEGGENVTERAKKAGADYTDVKMDVNERRYVVGMGTGTGDVLLEIEVHITAVGKPRQFHMASDAAISEGSVGR